MKNIKFQLHNYMHTYKRLYRLGYVFHFRGSVCGWQVDVCLCFCLQMGKQIWRRMFLKTFCVCLFLNAWKLCLLKILRISFLLAYMLTHTIQIYIHIYKLLCQQVFANTARKQRWQTIPIRSCWTRCLVLLLLCKNDVLLFLMLLLLLLLLF